MHESLKDRVLGSATVNLADLAKLDHLVTRVYLCEAAPVPGTAIKVSLVLWDPSLPEPALALAASSVASSSDDHPRSGPPPSSASLSADASSDRLDPPPRPRASPKKRRKRRQVSPLVAAAAAGNVTATTPTPTLSSLSSMDDESTLPNYLESDPDSHATETFSGEVSPSATGEFRSTGPVYPASLFMPGDGGRPSPARPRATSITTARSHSRQPSLPSPHVPARRSSVTASRAHRRSLSSSVQINAELPVAQRSIGELGELPEPDPAGAISQELGRIKARLRERRLKLVGRRVALLVDGAIASVYLNPDDRAAALSSAALVTVGMSSRGLPDSIFEPEAWDHESVATAVAAFSNWYQHGLPISERLVFAAMVDWNFGFESQEALASATELLRNSPAALVVHDLPAALDAKVRASRAKPLELAYFLAVAALLVHDVSNELALAVGGARSRPAWARSLEDALDAAAYTAFSLLVGHYNQRLESAVVVGAFLDAPSTLETASARAAAAAAVGSATVPSLPRPALSPATVIAVLDELAAVVAPWHPEVFGDTRAAVVSAVFKHINAVLCNAVLVDSRGATVSGGLKLKMAVSELEEWLAQHPELSGGELPARERLVLVRELADVLVMPKDALLVAETRGQVAPHLSSHQLVALLHAVQTDDYDQVGVEPGLVESLADELGVEQAGVASPRH
ncbi:uncharacterized protein AMSG_05502 [Thecamonas trahens ATCC 50062]|uniref:Dilute domain-containing protein n=1 Tax=Thecamonas trahens ATCC 50062 TaxID=461836 RepID=A0A0L0DBJ9_THETB|nr:hypothetical protein AMSG_05502 [Thecamonas trahens ATCC 50062]KNC49486.1 hypothetical protein AMSG_05502 [Thecamonas trahens ATCC 50062]|eukprot:XP_013757905.1 hypothetical protein AMSG_05502 [Thecamonas trahens ATCC 50062]